MKTLTFLLSIIIELYTMVFLLRIWMQMTHCDFYNSFSQFIMQTTQPIVDPLRRFVPLKGTIDNTALLVVLILCIIKATLLFMITMLPTIIWITVILILLKTTGLLVFWMLLVTTVINWINRQGHSSTIEHTLIHLTDPLLRPIRNFLPFISGVDFSPMILMLLLYVLNMGVIEFLQSIGNILLQRLWFII